MVVTFKVFERNKESRRAFFSVVISSSTCMASPLTEFSFLDGSSKFKSSQVFILTFEAMLRLSCLWGYNHLLFLQIYFVMSNTD